MAAFSHASAGMCFPARAITEAVTNELGINGGCIPRHDEVPPVSVRDAGSADLSLPPAKIPYQAVITGNDLR